MQQRELAADVSRACIAELSSKFRARILADLAEGISYQFFLLWLASLSHDRLKILEVQWRQKRASQGVQVLQRRWGLMSAYCVAQGLVILWLTLVQHSLDVTRIFADSYSTQHVMCEANSIDTASGQVPPNICSKSSNMSVGRALHKALTLHHASCVVLRYWQCVLHWMQYAMTPTCSIPPCAIMHHPSDLVLNVSEADDNGKSSTSAKCWMIWSAVW